VCVCVCVRVCAHARAGLLGITYVRQVGTKELHPQTTT
jgi:hypothetical protein